MRRKSTLSLSLAPLALASIFLIMPLAAQAALYAPGETLDPACAPTDPGCGISTVVASSTANSIPYYAANGSILSATSSVTILQNGYVGIGTTSPFALFSINGTAGGTGDIFAIATSTTGYATSTALRVSKNGNLYLPGGDGINIGYGTTAPPANGMIVMGNVGIGTTSPTANLAVTGQLYIDTPNASYNFLNNTEKISRKVYGQPIGIDLASTTGTQTWTTASLDYVSSDLVLAYQASDNSDVFRLAEGGKAILGWQIGSPFGQDSEFTVVGTSTATNIQQWINKNISGSVVASVDTNGIFNTTGGYNMAGLSALRQYSGQQSIFVGQGSGSAFNTDNSIYRNVGVGYNALSLATSSINNTAVGVTALQNTRVIDGVSYHATNNTALGYEAGQTNTSGFYNTFLGAASGASNTTGGANVFVGYNSGLNNTTGTENVAIGGKQSTVGTLNYNKTGSDNTSVGAGALAGSSGVNVNNNTALGWQAGYNVQANNNTLIGYQAGYDLTSGTQNIIIGYYPTTGVGVTTGNDNIFIGDDARAGVSGGGTNHQLNIGNLVFGTGLGSGSTLSTGNLGIGTTSPATKLEVGGSTANVTLDGYLNCSGFTSNANGLVACTASDQRLKQEIVPLDASSTLAALDSLNPVSFYWKPGTDRGAQQQYGLIAQQVEGIFPNLVSTSSPTALTPDGTLTVNYDGLMAPLIVAVQYLSNEISGFAQSITTAVLNATTVNTQQLCVGGTCVTGPQLQRLLQNSGQQGGSSQTTPITITDGAPPTDDATTTATSTVSTSSTDSGQADSPQADATTDNPAPSDDSTSTTDSTSSPQADSSN